MHDRSIPPRIETLRRLCMLAASLTIGTFIWFLLGDSDSLVAEETPAKRAVASEEILAEVGGIPVTESEVRSLVADQLEALEAQRQRLLEAALEVRVRELIVEVAAAERGMSPADLVAMEVDQKLDQVAQVDVETFFEENAFSEPREEVEMEIRRRLRMEAFIEELEKRPDVERSTEPLSP